MRVLALAGYDSFLNTARLIAPYFEGEGASVEFALVKARKRKQISQDQIAEMGINGPIQYIDIKKFCQSAEISQYDVVLSCLEGLSTRRLFHYLADLGGRRPYVVCVYPGLILRYPYDGFSMRAPADQLWLNCNRDVQMYSAMCRSFGLDPSNVRLFGNSSLLEKIERDPAAGSTGPVLFFEQAVIPRYYEERFYLVDRLCALAARNPERIFKIKARAVGTRATLHRSWHPIDDILKDYRKSENIVPDNIELTDEPAHQLLQSAAHCLTVSSTVAVEAMYAGVPTSIISDFGAHDDYGLQYFYDSGLVTSFDEIEIGKYSSARQEWLDQYTADPSKHIAEFVREVSDLSLRVYSDIALRTRCLASRELQDLLTAKDAGSFLEQRYKTKPGILGVCRRYVKNYFP